MGVRTQTNVHERRTCGVDSSSDERAVQPILRGQTSQLLALVSYWRVRARHSFTHAGIRESLRDINDRDSYAGDDIAVKPLGVFTHVKREYTRVNFVMARTVVG